MAISRDSYMYWLQGCAVLRMGIVTFEGRLCVKSRRNHMVIEERKGMNEISVTTRLLRYVTARTARE